MSTPTLLRMHPMHSIPSRDSVYSPTSFMDLVNSVRSHSRPSSTIDGYITHGPDGQSLVSFSSLPPSSSIPNPPSPLTMAATTTVAATAEERLEALLSNQYSRRMHCNRPGWYQDSKPLDTATKCFQPSRRNEVPLIGDWRTYAQIVAFQAKWKAKHFHDAHYEINGAVWGWSDPSEDVIVGLVTSPSVEMVEFIISNDPFRTPHIFVSHSEGEEPHCLDHAGNPDSLGDSSTTSPAPLPEFCGYTPRQAFVGPTGKDQLLLPPRAFSVNERDAAIIEYTILMTHRRNAMRRKAGEFQAYLRRGRAHRDHSVEPDEDFTPMNEIELVYEGLSERTECPLARLGIFQEDLAAMAELADSSSDSEDQEENEECSFEEQGEEISSDTRAILQRLGMLDSDSDSEDDEEHDLSETTSDDLSDSDESAEVSFASSATITVSPARVHALPTSFGCFDLHHLASDIDEEDSSVSSFFAGGDESDCESPDTEDSDC